MECGLRFYELQYMWPLNGMCAVVGYVCCCMLCGMLNIMWAVVGYVGCCMVCGLLYGIWAVA